jgi:hypothetical protein
MKRLLLIFSFLLITLFNVSSVYSELNTLSYTFLNALQPNVESTGDLVLLRMFYAEVTEYLDGTARSVSTNQTVLTGTESAEAAVLGRALFYPSPFKISNGSKLGYRLSKDMNIEVRIYNLRAHEVFRETYNSGTPGGRSSLSDYYNKVSFDSSNLGDLPAGIYFYLIMNDGKVLSKGKFAILP